MGDYWSPSSLFTIMSLYKFQALSAVNIFVAMPQRILVTPAFSGIPDNAVGTVAELIQQLVLFKVFPLDFLGITPVNFVLARVQMAFVSTPVIGKITGNPKGIDSALYLTLQRRFFHGLLHQQQPSTCLITEYNLPREPFHAG